MDIKELIEELKKLHTGDEESDHWKADDLLLRFINNTEVSKAFNEIEKWYA